MSDQDMTSVATGSGASPLPEQTVGYLEFFKRWDTPLDDDAARVFSRLVRDSPDFETFQALAPAGSEERLLFRRHIDSFEEAAVLIRDGKMREDLFFDAWYGMPQSWHRARPFVVGMRAEANQPDLYEGFEWLAGRAEHFWAEREEHPPHWEPIKGHAPTAGDRAVYEAFNLIWSTPRDVAGRDFVDDLAKRAPDFETFSQIVQPGSEEYIKFDRVFCAYDQAGVLVKNGIVHPALFFDAWRSPTALWSFAQPWIAGLRERSGTSHLYDNVDWLVEFEREGRSEASHSG